MSVRLWPNEARDVAESHGAAVSCSSDEGESENLSHFLAVSEDVGRDGLVTLGADGS